MAINWRREADNIIDTSDLLGSIGDILKSTLNNNSNQDIGDDEQEFLLGNFGSVFVTKPWTNRSDSGNLFPTVRITYNVEIKFRFEPRKPNVNASEIAFIQIVKCIDWTTNKVAENVLRTPAYMERLTANNWFADRSADPDSDLEDKLKYIWYGYSNEDKFLATHGQAGICKQSSNSIVPAIFSDGPGYTITPDDKGDFNPINWEYYFQLYLIAKSGHDIGKIYGGIFWGFKTNRSKGIDEKLAVTHHPTFVKTGYSNDFKEAISKWNEQAAGDEFVPKNHPDQVSINILKFN